MTAKPSVAKAAPPGPTPHAEFPAAQRDWRRLRLLAAAALAVAAAGALSLNLVDPDLWGHVAYGRDTLAEGRLHRTATHTFTAQGRPWINHEVLAELALAAGFDTLGVSGMLVAKLGLGVAILGAMALVARSQGVRVLTAWSLLLLVANNLTPFFIMRPQLLSFACCAAVLVLMHLAMRPWRTDGVPAGPACRVDWRWLWLVPPVMVLWVNSHGGFVAGYAIIGVLLAGAMVEAVAVDRRRAGPVTLGLAAVGAVTLAGVLVNPYGVALVSWLAESLGSPRPEITEWAPPKPSDPVFWPLVALASVNAIAWGLTGRRRNWAQAALLLLVAWQSATHLRHIAFFALLSGFWTPPHLQSVLSRWRASAAAGLPIVRIGPAVKYAAAAALVFAIAAQGFGLAIRLTALPVPHSGYPVDAFAFLARHDVHGRMVVAFNWSQYAIGAFPESTVSFDGRFRTCYPQEAVDRHFDWLLGENNGQRRRSEASGPVDGRRALEHGQPEVVVVDRRYGHAAGVMRAQAARPASEWSLLYQDGVAQVWGRKRVFDCPASGRYLPPADRRVSDAVRPVATAWPALPERRADDGGGLAGGGAPQRPDASREG